MPFNENQITTFEYIGFDSISKNYKINNTYDDEYLTIKNNWKYLVFVKTEINYDKKSYEGLVIRCKVIDSNQTCEEYSIDKTRILQFQIETFLAKKEEEYKNICFKTVEINNENNYFEDCIPIINIRKY